MKNNKGFTLMEVLLAALIVGTIGLALAALTTAAVRESGIGRTRAALRNELSLGLQQIRQDIEQSSAIVKCPETDDSYYGKYLFCLERTIPHVSGPNELYTDVIYYQYKKGSTPSPLNSAHKIGGRLWRFSKELIFSNGEGQYGDFTSYRASVFLNIKDIGDGDFVSPSFTVENDPETGVASRVRVQLIMEVGSNPVVNETVEEVFALPHGFAVGED